MTGETEIIALWGSRLLGLALGQSQDSGSAHAPYSWVLEPSAVERES